MCIFFEILRYELKKSLCRKRSVIVLTAVTVLAALSVFGTLLGNTYYEEENGEMTIVSAYDEDMLERKYGEKLSGRVIDAELIMEAVEAYGKLSTDRNMTYQEYSENVIRYSEIYFIVDRMLGLDSLEDFQKLTRKQAERFDEIRLARRESVIAKAQISDNVRSYWQKCLDRSPRTLTYQYSGGYYRFVVIMYTTAMLAAAAMAIIFSGIFSEEYTSGADNLVLSSKHGRGLVIGAKLCTVFTVSAVFVLLLTAISYAEAMLVWGSSGAGGDITLIRNVFPYPLTIGQAAGLYVLGLTMACLLFSAITSALSAALKAPFNTIVIMAILLIAPIFISIPDSAPTWVFCLENLLPTNMMSFGGIMYDFQYEIFGLVIPPYVFLPLYSALGCGGCAAIAYRSFRRHQV